MKGTRRLLPYILFIIGLQWEKACALSMCEGKHVIKCKNKACVPASFRCDGEDDCGDNSDETDCKNTAQKPLCMNNKFLCKNGRCIARSYICDGEDDCLDNSDEVACKKQDLHSSCNSTVNFLCRNGRCIPRTYTCDTVDDCGDRSDESTVDGPVCQNERTTCPDKNMFQCKQSGYCLSKLKVCDGQIDCNIGENSGDKSDEENCSSHTCLANQMKCDNGVCISSIWKCNKMDDCGDGSDEKNCSFSCGKDEFKCEISAECISSSLQCNGFVDCKDGSDEQHCIKTTQPPSRAEHLSCAPTEYKCSSGGKCISKTWLCDGNRDCPNGEDERAIVCQKTTCDGGEFQCSNGQCVARKYKCDGVHDCFDKSDEKECNIIREFRCSKETYHCRNSSKCIHPLQFCDGLKNCPHGEDEGPLCGVNECLVEKGFCSHGCKDLPIGHICTCPKGYKLSKDNKTCVDINECKQFGTCTQGCENLPGSFHCSCDKGFTLDLYDKKTCRAGDPKPYLVFAESFDIREVSLSGDDYKSIISIWTNIVALAVHARENMVYWADSYHKKICRAPMDNPTNVDVIMDSDIDLPKGLDVDWIGRKLYWTDSKLKTISVSNLDGSNRKVLVQSGDREEFRNIAVHPEKGFIFWTNWVAQTHSKIERANLDGSNRVTIVSSNLVWVSGLAIDYQLDRLYWSDRYHRHISSSTINGNDVRKIVTNLYEPTGLAIFEDKVYWIDRDQKKLSRANKFDGFNRLEYKENFNSPIDLAIYHPLAQKEVSHPCQVNNGGCSHLCFSTMDSRRFLCSCPQHLYLQIDGRTCGDDMPKEEPKPEIQVLPVVSGKKCVESDCEPRGSAALHPKNFTVAYVVGSVLVILVVLCVVIVTYVYRKKRNQFGLSIIYETETDLVSSESENKKDSETTKRCFPNFTIRCKNITNFDNINFKPFKEEDPDIPANSEQQMDLVMDECPIDDDRQPIIAHMV